MVIISIQILGRFRTVTLTFFIHLYIITAGVSVFGRNIVIALGCVLQMFYVRYIESARDQIERGVNEDRHFITGNVSRLYRHMVK